MKYYLEEGRARGPAKVKYLFQECQQLGLWNKRHGPGAGQKKREKTPNKLCIM